LNPHARIFLAETVATAILVGVGVGAVHVAVLTGGLTLVGVALTWGLAVVLLITVCGPASGAHANPAVSIAMASLGRLPWNRVPTYLTAQCLGALLASWLLNTLFSGSLAHAAIATGRPLGDLVSAVNIERWPWEAALAEAGGAGLIAATIVGATRRGFPPALATPAIGASVAAAIIVLAPLSQAGFNPARDLGPRLVAACQGVDAPLDLAVWTVYGLAPILGAVICAWIAHLLTPPEHA
jgi:glycerol uptake facilitator protein